MAALARGLVEGPTNSSWLPKGFSFIMIVLFQPEILYSEDVLAKGQNRSRSLPIPLGLKFSSPTQKHQEVDWGGAGTKAYS